MDYTLPQAMGYLQALHRLEGEALVTQSLAVLAAQQDPNDWAAWARKFTR